MKNNKLMTRLKAIGVKLHQSKLAFLGMLLESIIVYRTVNLRMLCDGMISEAIPDSCYRRAQRFFQGVRLKQVDFMKMMLNLKVEERVRLCVDRTNWQVGKVNMNVFMLAFVEDGIAVPVTFDMLDKKGNSNEDERIALLERVLEHIPASKIEMFTADREFIGRTWLAFLVEKNIPFVIRVRKNMLAHAFCPVHFFFNDLKVGESKVLHQSYEMEGLVLQVAGTRSSEGELVIVITNRSAANALAYYKERWAIECCFKALKSSGFNLEATHLKDQERLATLVQIVCLAYMWALRIGTYLARLKPIRFKSHGRKERSVFRVGLNDLKQAIVRRPFDPSLLDERLRFLSCT